MEKFREPDNVRLQSSRLDDKDGDIVAHGWLDLAAIKLLKVGDYQREVLEGHRGKKSQLKKGVEEGVRLPDIMLGMRGQSYTPKGQDMLLENPVYVVDGLQRISALMKFAEDHPDKEDTIRIGAEVRFNTNRDTETALFEVLNVARKSMSPSVVLRNKRNYSDSITTLYGLSMHDSKFPLIGKVCWDQQMHRGELMTALTLAKVVMTLHRGLGPGGRHLSNNKLLPETMDRLAKKHGLQNFRNNISTFFEVLDAVWGVRGLKYKDQMTHLRGNFMIQLAGVFADHEDFWTGNKLTVDASFRNKLKSFPIDDPTVIRLAGGGVSTGELLRRHIIDHLNKNKTKDRHLKLRDIEQYHKSGTQNGRTRYAA